MKNLMQGLLLATLIVSQPLLACSKDGKDGFLPKNNFNIPVNDKAAAGISEAEFNQVIDQVSSVYAPIVAKLGGNLEVIRRWTDGTVNAYAERDGDSWQVTMFGGLARHRTITADGFRLVVCHELGHHIGGAPKYAGDDWATNEGQADYFATLKCLRKVWASEDNIAIAKGLDAPEYLTVSCAKNWSTEEERALCVRSSMAGDSVARLFAALSWGKAAKFETPDPKQVSSTFDAHPATQCRLDTYFQGSLCEKSMSDDVSFESELTGTCNALTGQTSGLRPRCWFKPQAE